MNKIKILCLGADPEVFLTNIATRQIEASIPYISGTKKDPQELEEGFTIQKDNILAEFNIPPSNTKDDFVFNIQKGLKLLGDYLPDHLAINISSSNHINNDIIEEFDEAKIFGCEPDYLAWNPTVPHEILANPEVDTLRTAGGHVHIGYESPSEELNIVLIKALDLFLGVPSVLMDDDTTRRSIYGAAGSLRHKKYGVEYRSLSNFWLTDVSLIEWVWENVQQAVDFVNSGQIIDESSDSQLIQDCINDSDKELAIHYINNFNINIPSYVKEQEKELQSEVIEN